MSDMFFTGDVVSKIGDARKYIVRYDEHPNYWLTEVRSDGYTPTSIKIVSDGSWVKVGEWSFKLNKECEVETRTKV